MKYLRLSTCHFAVAAALGCFAGSAVAQETLAPIDVTPIAPGAGASIPLDKYPGSVTVVTTEDIERAYSLEPQEAIQKYTPSATLIDAAGNNVRTQLDYRGFGAGSINGFPQGLAVYLEGIRINEVFGDVVNWDLFPSNAVKAIAIESGNPVYGLNALGGAAVVELKDGFDFQGVEIDVMAGSHGRKQISTQIGIQQDTWAVYFAGQHIEEDGWRDFSPLDVQRMFADIGFKGSKLEAHVNLTWADSSAGVVAATPEELLNVDYARTFTSPQVTDLETMMPSINAKADVTDTLSVSGLAYYRRFNSSVIDGNVFEGEECGEVADELEADGDIPASVVPNTAAGLLAASGVGADNVCQEDLENDLLVALRDGSGNLIDPGAINVDEPFGVIDRITQAAESFGFNLQAVEKSQVFGLNNQFVVGASYDRGNVRYKTSSEFGQIGERYVVDGSGVVIASPDDFAGRDVDVDTEFFGIYFTDTLDLTSQLALTFGGRYNHASIDLVDLSGVFPGITSSHTFERFNPNVGATYTFNDALTVYGGYSESNRAPTPAELACANPDNPCPIESFLTDDPPLDQVIARTVEAGARGTIDNVVGNGTLSYTLGYFRTENQDDILFVSSPTAGRGFFLNAGDTLRQGVEIGLKYSNGPLSLYGGYSYVKATYEDAIEINSPANPLGVPCSGEPDETCINVSPGDNLANIPNHRFKAGFDYWLTSKWKFGMDVVGASGQYHLGDEANLLPKTGGYARVDAHTSYDVTDQIQFYGFVNNIFDREYGLFGTLFENDEAPTDPAPFDEFNNPRSIVPGAPVSAYGGVKVKF